MPRSLVHTDSYLDSAFVVCDRIGRIWATRQLCLLWILGIAIFMGNNGSLGAVYAGRFIAGLGVGQTVVVAPVYLAEIVSTREHVTESAQISFMILTVLGSCLHSRSLYLCLHGIRLSRYVLQTLAMFSHVTLEGLPLLTHVFSGIVLAYFANYGCQVNMGDYTHKRWVNRSL